MRPFQSGLSKDCYSRTWAYGGQNGLGAALLHATGGGIWQAKGSRQACINERGVMSGVMRLTKQGQKP